MLEISSPKNQIIKEVKSLYRRKNRWESKLFIIEGRKVIEEALLNKLPLKYLIFTDKFLTSPDGSSFLEKVKEQDGLIKVSENLFKSISDTDSPQGILAVASFIERSIEEVYSMEDPLLLFLNELQDPGNIGTIIRSADAFNIDGIILSKGSVDPYNLKVVRSTMGSIFRVPLYFCEDAVSFLKRIQESSIQIIATSLDGTSLYDGNFKTASLVIIGNESRGVDSSLISMADRTIKIPMPGQAESLNAGVAASIIMYEAMRGKSELS